MSASHVYFCNFPCSSMLSEFITLDLLFSQLIKLHYQECWPGPTKWTCHLVLFHQYSAFFFYDSSSSICFWNCITWSLLDVTFQCGASFTFLPTALWWEIYLVLRWWLCPRMTVKSFLYTDDCLKCHIAAGEKKKKLPLIVLNEILPNKEHFIGENGVF